MVLGYGFNAGFAGTAPSPVLPSRQRPEGRHKLRGKALFRGVAWQDGVVRARGSKYAKQCKVMSMWPKALLTRACACALHLPALAILVQKENLRTLRPALPCKRYGRYGLRLFPRTPGGSQGASASTPESEEP